MADAARQQSEAEAEAPPPAPATPEPAPTLVSLKDPVMDTRGEGRKLLRAEVEPCENFAYVTFEMNGRVLVLSNRRPFEHSVNLETCDPGPVEIAVRAYDESGRCIATDSRTMTLVPASSLGH